MSKIIDTQSEKGEISIRKYNNIVTQAKQNQEELIITKARLQKVTELKDNIKLGMQKKYNELNEEYEELKKKCKSLEANMKSSKKISDDYEPIDSSKRHKLIEQEARKIEKEFEDEFSSYMGQFKLAKYA